MILGNHNTTWTIAAILISLVGCSFSKDNSPYIRILLDRVPVSLNPRDNLEFTGQQIDALLFDSLVKIDSDLKVAPSHAVRWQNTKDGKGWIFWIKPGLTDHAGEPITAKSWEICLENFRVGLPLSRLKNAIPYWTGTEALDEFKLLVKTEKIVPYLPEAIARLFYFRQKGSPPCTEIDPTKPIITSGDYRFAKKQDLTPDLELSLIPHRAGLSALQFLFFPDENTRALALIRGSADVAWNAFSLSKTRWLRDQYSDRFSAIERDGIKIDYLAFNTQHPILSKVIVRKAIAHSINRREIIAGKYGGYFLTQANSLISPYFSESTDQTDIPIDYNPALAEKLLDQAGYPRGKNGVRFSLHYKTTSNPVGREKALLFQAALLRVGIHIQIDMIEPAVFTASIQAGNFQLFSSRWIRVDDPSLLFVALHSGEKKNYPKYKNTQVDKLLEKAQDEIDKNRRATYYKEVQRITHQELPYFPLWYWNNTLIFSKKISGLTAKQLSPSGSFLALGYLKKNSRAQPGADHEK